MRLVVQRVQRASVEVNRGTVGEIGPGLLVLIGTTHGDTMADSRVLADKLVGLRIFTDDVGKMNHSVVDAGGAVLVVSQFTLYGSVRKGRRPSFAAAGDPEVAEGLIAGFIESVRAHGVAVESGMFGAAMKVSLLNDGPVTVIIDTVDGRIV